MESFFSGILSGLSALLQIGYVFGSKPPHLPFARQRVHLYEPISQEPKGPIKPLLAKVASLSQEKRMKRIMLAISPLIVMGGLLTNGCVSHHREVAVTTEPVTTTTTTTRRTIVVTEEPPPPREEVRTVAPSEAHVWVSGYWSYADGRWVWIPGHWELRPRTNAIWVPGHWDKDPSGKGWIWTSGYWE